MSVNLYSASEFANIAATCVRGSHGSADAKRQLTVYFDACAQISKANALAWNSSYADKVDACTADEIRAAYSPARIDRKRALNDVRSLRYNCISQGGTIDDSVAFVNALIDVQSAALSVVISLLGDE